MTNQTYQKVLAARSHEKISIQDLIDGLIDHFFELHGDRAYADDEAVIGGIGYLDKRPVTVIGIQKGDTPTETIARHGGSPTPAGYRKALRLMKQAEKFHRPVLTLINTPGAWSDAEAEYKGIGTVIAQCLKEGLRLKIPYLSIIVGEAGSGGALALAVGDRVWMFKDSIYSVISPEGYASILFKDASRVEEAASVLKLTPDDLLEAGVIEQILPEYHRDDNLTVLKNEIVHVLDELSALSESQLLAQRYQRFRRF
ncbi:MAG: acetyl-CoA carboxylase carboxyl transferase subunit alpha [Aerococcus sp.]|nr:acetyl-CoA carboxylase carboxyl transferase subunit alpha [Aerococcus sp.]